MEKTAENIFFEIWFDDSKMPSKEESEKLSLEFETMVKENLTNVLKKYFGEKIYCPIVKKIIFAEVCTNVILVVEEFHFNNFVNDEFLNVVNYKKICQSCKNNPYNEIYKFSDLKIRSPRKVLLNIKQKFFKRH